MQTLENLLQKFWDDSITWKELLRLQQLLRENDSIDLIATREQIEIKNPDDILLAVHDKMLSAHNASVSVKRIWYPFMWWAAAACLLVMVGSYYFVGQKPIHIRQVAVQVRKKPLLKNIFNTTDQVMNITLPDGSQVKLYPLSSLSYEVAFSATKRTINLSGKAFFKVAKDAHRPFIVASDRITTTALGTAFLVNMRAQNKISVKLFKGKVVIRSIVKAIFLMDDKYLLPGQEFSYDLVKKQVTVAAFKQEKNIARTVNASNQRKGKVIKSLVFNNEPLQKILKRLAVIYKVKMLYKHADVKELFFTGTFSGSDNLSDVLSIICTINDLEYKLHGNLATINKVTKN